MAIPGREHDRRRPGTHRGQTRRWAIVLVRGDGTRLRDLTRRIAGDDRPKQFCRLLGETALLAETWRRIALEVLPGPNVLLVSHAHERFYAPLLADAWPRRVVVQPENRGIAPVIFYALLRVATVARNAAVAISPSDHYVSDDEAFMAHVGAGFDRVAARPELVALLAITPDRPETEYGWIEPGEPVAGPSGGRSIGSDASGRSPRPTSGGPSLRLAARGIASSWSVGLPGSSG